MSGNHNHVLRDFGPAFAWAIGLNATYVIVEAGFGFVSGSLALLADAAHNLTDVGGLVLAWGAVALSRRTPSARHTYGLGRTSILAALVNGVALMIAVGALAWEAVGRFSAPAEVAGGTVLWVALLGIAINAGTAFLFMRAREHDINIEGAFLHMAADAAVSGAVVVSGFVILATGWTWVDPAAGLLLSAVIAWSAFGLLKSALHLSLDGVPQSIDKQAVSEWLGNQPGVASVHDLHIWALSTTTTALTAHLVMPAGRPDDEFLDNTAEALEHQFGIGHATLQIERGDGADCRLAPDNVV
ncbi:MAG: cation diffusion facilitator family transporter [Hyphomicrobiaceae bacterium]|nr:cation diffusion facilitator family transporter [Hyphomicrobiaceae bacterium]